MTKDANVEMAACVVMAHQVIDQLSAMHQHLGQEKAGGDFQETVFLPMMRSHPDPNDIEDRFEDGDVTNLDMMKLSCAYVVGSLSAHGSGDNENAWLGISHAQYWMGVAYGLGFMKGAFSQLARQGSKGRDERWEPLRRKALELAAQGDLQTGVQYKSRTAAVAGIRAGLKSACEEMEAPASGKRVAPPADKTIYSWLKSMNFSKK